MVPDLEGLDLVNAGRKDLVDWKASKNQPSISSSTSSLNILLSGQSSSWTSSGGGSSDDGCGNARPTDMSIFSLPRKR